METESGWWIAHGENGWTEAECDEWCDTDWATLSGDSECDVCEFYNDFHMETFTQNWSSVALLSSLKEDWKNGLSRDDILKKYLYHYQ